MNTFDEDDSVPPNPSMSYEKIGIQNPDSRISIVSKGAGANELFGHSLNKIPAKVVSTQENILIYSNINFKKQQQEIPFKNQKNLNDKNKAKDLPLPNPNHYLSSNELEKNKEIKQGPFNEKQQPRSASPEKVRVPEVNPPDIKKARITLKLIDQLRNNILPVRLEESLKNLLKKNSISKLLQDYHCPTCKEFSFIIKLTCSHTACLSCIKISLLNFSKSPSLKLFKESRCKFCLLFPTNKDVEFIISKEAADFIYSLEIKKQCTFCERNLRLMSNFLPELECLHLCRECYLNDMHYGGTKCINCSKEYEGIEITSQRVEQCVKCKKYGKIKENNFRALHSDHFLCSDCLINVQENKDYRCPSCEYELSGLDINVLNMFFYKICSGCGLKKPFSDIRECSCPYNLCYACIQEYNHNCS